MMPLMFLGLDAELFAIASPILTLFLLALLRIGFNEIKAGLKGVTDAVVLKIVAVDQKVDTVIAKQLVQDQELHRIDSKQQEHAVALGRLEGAAEERKVLLGAAAAPPPTPTPIASEGLP